MTNGAAATRCITTSALIHDPWALFISSLRSRKHLNDQSQRAKALVTGITGQDGSYLAELLLEKGYEVHGIIRRASTFNTVRLEHLYQDQHEPNTRLFLHYGDVTDGQRLTNLVLDLEPDEIYNLAAQSHVRVSFDEPMYTVDVGAKGTMAVLEAARQLGKRKPVRVYQASSSEMFGDVREVPQTEATPFYPRSPYACAKVFAFHQTVNYREAYNLFACNGILFNHESPRRGETFVTRKITRAATRIKEGLQDKLYLGNLDAKATGVTPKNTSRRCGSCSNTTSPTTTSSPRTKRTPSASFSKPRFSPSISTGRTMSRSTRAISGPPRSIC